MKQLSDYIPAGTGLAKRIGNILAFSLADESIAPAQCLSVSIDTGEIAVVYGNRFLSRIKIRGIRRYPLEEGKYPTPEELAAAVHLAVNELQALKADITLILPKAWTIMKKADFPAVVKKNLGSVIGYELDRLTPLSVEQAYYDYQVTGEEGNRLQIMVAALKADTLDPYLRAFRQKGIGIKKVTINLTAPGALSHKNVNLSFRRPEKDIPSAALGGILELLGTGPRGFNLLEKGVHPPVRTPWALTIILLAALAALGLFSLVASIQIETKRVAAVEQEIALREKEVRQIEAMKKEIAALEQETNAIDQFKTARPMTINLLKELTQILPRDTWLNRVHITDAAINIEGYSASAAGLLPKLESSRYFQKVEFASPTFRDARQNADRFVIKMEIEGLAREKEKNAKQ